VICPLCSNALGADQVRMALDGIWQAVDRGCFEDLDRRSEALEIMLAAPFAVDVPLRAPRFRRAAPPLVGLRVGRFVVTGITHRQRRDGKLERCWCLRCDCGAASLVTTADFNRRRGMECKACANRRRGRERAALLGGCTVRELADRAGVSETAIRQRVRLGWSLERLTVPAQRPGLPAMRRVA
jgi:hypothetical protein